MKKYGMLLLKIIGGLLILLIGLIAIGIGYARIKPRLDRWYFSRLNLRPSETPVALNAPLKQELDTIFGKGHFGSVSTFIVWQDGETRYEYNRPGVDPTDPLRVWSISKSVTSAAYGVAAFQGIAPPLDTTVASQFTEYETFGNDPNRASLTLADLMSMQSGYLWDELNGFPTDYHKFAASGDWLAYMAQREMERRPGEAFVYNSANTILMGEILGRQVGLPFDEFVAQNLYTKLGINRWDWETGPDGVIQAGGGGHLSPYAMLKLGQLYLQDGVWEGERLIATEWIEQSTSYKSEVRGYLDYGYHWWIAPEDSALTDALTVKDVYFASGLGGNYIFVIPHLDAIVVITANESGGEMERAWPALQHFVFPALAAEAKSNP